MNGGLIIKALRETWLGTLFFGAVFALFEGILSYVVPTFSKQFSEQLMSMKFAQTIFKAIIGADSPGAPGPETFTSLCWVHPVVLAVVWAHSIITCTRVPAGEVDRGTIDVLLGLPVSRWGLVISETAVWLAGVAAILAMALLGHLIGSRNVAADARPELGRVLIVIANLACLSFAVGAAAWLASSLSDRRGRAITIVFVVMVASFLVNYLAQLWQPAQSIAFLGVLRYYRPRIILRDGAWPVTDMAVLLCVGGACWTAAGMIFARRDLNTV